VGREVVLRATGLVKRYRAPSGAPISVLAGVDLDVRAGELVVIFGTSGSGKSTLLNVLGLLEEADAGEIWFGGQSVTRLSRSARSRQRGRWVGFVFQSFLLLPSLTALDNVLLAARYVGRAGPAARQRALALLEAFGVLDRRDHYPPQLSGGEQQRVAFCRAVLNDPPLLLADEPTGNLDDDNSQVILEALRARARAGGAVVVVSHRAEALEGASAAYRLQGGRLGDRSLAKEDVS
jgi:ABC-type lipoprotein export system ATPase subunit